MCFNNEHKCFVIGHVGRHMCVSAYTLCRHVLGVLMYNHMNVCACVCACESMLCDSESGNETGSSSCRSLVVDTGVVHI